MGKKEKKGKKSGVYGILTTSAQEREGEKRKSFSKGKKKLDYLITGEGGGREKHLSPKRGAVQIISGEEKKGAKALLSVENLKEKRGNHQILEQRLEERGFGGKTK